MPAQPQGLLKILRRALMLGAVLLAVAAGTEVETTFRGQNRSDVGVLMFDNEGPAVAAGLVVCVTLSVAAFWVIRRAFAPRA